MAVYTPVPEHDLKNLLMSYDIGDLVSYEGIEAGVSNTNYFVTTTKDRFVLTLFEPRRVKPEDIPFFIQYMRTLEKHGVSCPRVMIRKDGQLVSDFCARPTAIFSLLEGKGVTIDMIDSTLCERAGGLLAKMHLAAMDGPKKPANHFGLPRWHDWMQSIGDKMNAIDPGLYDLARAELNYITPRWPNYLPSGEIHGDYFPDNVFFKGGDITGVIDFHFVCYDLFAYDLAIACNAWCFDPQNNFKPDLMESFLRGYDVVRLLSPEENQSIPLLCRAAALRFLLSRVEEKLNWKPGDFMKPHDPMVFEKRLRHFQS